MRRILFGLVLLFMLLPVLTVAQDVPPQVPAALADLNSRLGLNLKPEDVLWELHQRVFDDASMGCPQPGASYYQGKSIGYSLQITALNIIWDYRVSPDLHVILCNSDSRTAPTVIPITPTAVPPRAYPTSAPPAVPIHCMGAPPSRLKIAGLAKLSRRVTVTVGMYDISTDWVDPFTSVNSGDILKVLDGPLCTGNQAWWEMLNLVTFSRGWVAENDEQTYVFDPVDPSTIGSIQIDTPFPTRAADAYCTNKLPSRLMLNTQARVLPNINTYLFSEFNEFASATYDLDEGHEVHIIDGPRCNNTAIWWGVVDSQTGMQGWITETNSTSYLFEPVGIADNGTPAFQYNPTPTPIWMNPNLTPIATPQQPAPYYLSTATPPLVLIVGTLTPAADANCVPHLPSRLKVGDQVRVLIKMELQLWPYTNAPHSAQIPPGEIITIVDGPHCYHNTIFWKTKYNKQKGWVQEAQTEKYLLEPA